MHPLYGNNINFLKNIKNINNVLGVLGLTIMSKPDELSLTTILGPSTLDSFV
jgi:hypothetical protein